MWRAVGAWPGSTPVARSLVGVDRWLGRLTRTRASHRELRIFRLTPAG